MYRGIFIVFVALAIFQGAFAINVVNVEPHSIINLDLTNETSPTTKLFDGERASAFIGDLKMGNRSNYHYIVHKERKFENQKDFVVRSKLTFFAERNIIYLEATNKAGSTIAFCGNESTLGRNVITVNGRLPPLSNSTVIFTLGLSSSTVNAIHVLLIPYTLITLLVGNFHL